MRKRKAYFQEEKPPEHYWPSFTDMMAMTVLVMLFIAIIAFVQSIYEAYDQQEIKNELAKVTSVKKHIANILENTLAENVGQDNVTRGPNNTISVQGDILFDTASAKVKPQGREILHNVANGIVEIIENQQLSQYIYIILVEGHTDSVPYDNWTLSTERAVAVVKYMKKSNPKLKKNDYATYLAATGYSKYKPVVKGDSPEALQQNRRISFQIILDDNKWQTRIRELVAK